MRRFGRYELIEKIATGGMAEIFIGRQHALPGFERLIVLKRILPELSADDTFVRMFLDEARTSAELNHPNVVQIFDLGVMDDAYFIAMELIEGEDLIEITHRAKELGRTVPLGLAARIVADTCKALHHAHEKIGADGRPLSIVHRDVSPHNILVSYEGGVKMVDFGIAKARTQSHVTKSGMLKGKYSYMSPEQCLAEPLDRRSDLFSLGIVLYELTTGRRLFDLERSVDILEAITEAPIPPPSRVVRWYPGELERIVMRALERDPDKRYPTALEMQRDLDAFLRGEKQSSSVHLAKYLQELFGEDIEEKRRVIDALVSEKTVVDFDDHENARDHEIDTGVFRRAADRGGLAIGPTVLGRRGQTQWRYVALDRRRARMDLSRMPPMTKAAIVAAAAAAFMCAALLTTL